MAPSRHGSQPWKPKADGAKQLGRFTAQRAQATAWAGVISGRVNPAWTSNQPLRVGAACVLAERNVQENARQLLSPFSLARPHDVVRMLLLLANEKQTVLSVPGAPRHCLRELFRRIALSVSVGTPSPARPFLSHCRASNSVQKITTPVLVRAPRVHSKHLDTLLCI